MPAAISGLRPVWSESQPVSELPDAPDGGIDGGDDGDLAHARAVRSEVERREAPGERVVEVVDEPGLGAGAQHRIAHRRAPEGAPEPARARAGVAALLCSCATCAPVSRTAKTLTSSPATTISAGTDPDDRARREARCEHAGREGRGGDAEVAGRLVQTEREPAPLRPGQVDLHHDGHRPGEALVDAEQEVRGDDEPPGRCERDQQRDRQGDEPSR